MEITYCCTPYNQHRWAPHTRTDHIWAGLFITCGNRVAGGYHRCRRRRLHMRPRQNILRWEQLVRMDHYYCWQRHPSASTTTTVAIIIVAATATTCPYLTSGTRWWLSIGTTTFNRLPLSYKATSWKSNIALALAVVGKQTSSQAVAAADKRCS